MSDVTVTLADPMVTVDGWTPDMNRLGAYHLRVRTTPEERKALIAKGRDKGIPVKEVSPQKLDFMSGGAVHQSVAVVVAAHKYCSLDDILQYAAERHEPPFIIICEIH